MLCLQQKLSFYHRVLRFFTNNSWSNVFWWKSINSAGHWINLWIKSRTAPGHPSPFFQTWEHTYFHRNTFFSALTPSFSHSFSCSLTHTHAHTNTLTLFTVTKEFIEFWSNLSYCVLLSLHLMPFSLNVLPLNSQLRTIKTLITSFQIYILLFAAYLFSK